jgi:hypothetical protein
MFRTGAAVAALFFVSLAAACGSDQAGSSVSATQRGLVPRPSCAPGLTTACAALGASWSHGDATCRADGSGWDVSACTLAQPGKAETVKPALRSERYATARCNDGSPFAFVVRLAPRPSSTWVVYLEGGYWCDDFAFPCGGRDPAFTSTMPFPDGRVGDLNSGGVFDLDPSFNPDFYAANAVAGHYCTSDFWSGATTERRPTSGDTNQGWYFSGHAAIDALFGILIEHYGLDDADPSTRVLFGGGSAGAWGAHLNQANVAAALPRTSAAGRLSLLVDAGWMTNLDDPDHPIAYSPHVPDAEVWRRARSFWGATFDPDCEAAERAAGRDPAGCFSAPTWYPHVARRGPVFVQQCSFDASFTLLHAIPPSGPVAERWRSDVLQSFDAAKPSWLFSGSLPSYHAIAGGNDLLGTERPGLTFMQVLHAFWVGEAPRQVYF